MLLIDTIGIETGMHLYDEALVCEFEKRGIKTSVLSNYKASYVKCQIDNFYKGGKLTKIWKLIKSLFVNLLISWRYRKNTIVYQSFGLRIVDILFILPYTFHKNFYVIAHDIFEITKEIKEESFKRKLQLFVYKHVIKKIICHSDQAAKVLKESVEFEGKIICFPHFSYCYKKEYNLSDIDTDLQKSIIPGKVNCLFFGQIRKSKGIDILVDAIKTIENKHLNIIIAGNDKEGLLKDVLFPEGVIKVCRYITDSEMKFLFDNVDIILLPYKEIYQSGVLENVVYWRKYAITSDVDAFKHFFAKYPSFGEVYSPNTGYAMGECLNSLELQKKTYSKDDISIYNKDHDVLCLIEQMNIDDYRSQIKV